MADSLDYRLYHVFTGDVAVLCSHGNLSFACTFKHCSLKISESKPLKHNQQ